MSFSRFVWLLQRKQLWLGRADMLGDPWEIALAGDQLDHIIERNPITALPLTGERRETAMERAARIISAWRQKAFCELLECVRSRVACALAHLLRTGRGRRRTVDPRKAARNAVLFRFIRLQHAMPGAQRRTPTLIDLATRKRPMFAYEQEVRLVYVVEFNQAETLAVREPYGRCLDWNPESHADFIRVHPLADSSFMETVVGAVGHYTPTLRGRVVWSAMRDPPPI